MRMEYTAPPGGIHAWKMESALSEPLGLTPSLQETQGTEEQVQHHQVAICQGQIVGHSTDQQFSFSNKLLEVGGGNGGVGESTVKNKRD